MLQIQLWREFAVARAIQLLRYFSVWLVLCLRRLMAADPNPSHAEANTALNMETTEPTFANYRRPRPGITPAWCKTAFKFERARQRTDKTDWGFVTPVWILMGLICVVSQVAAMQWAYSAIV